MSRVGQQGPVSRGSGSAGGLDLKTGAIYGVGAWIVGLVLTGVLAWVEFRDAAKAMDQMGGGGGFSQFSGTGAESLPSAVDFVGWLFYNAHFVDVGLSIMGQGFWVNLITANVNLTGQVAEMASGESMTQMETGLETLFGTVPTAVWLLVPVVVLVGAGYLVAKKSGAYDTSGGAKAGASIAAGYVLLAIGGTFLFAYTLPSGSMGMSLSISPQMMMAGGLMGLVYPAVFGGIGGAIAASTTEQPARTQTPRAPQGQAGYQQGGQQPPANQGHAQAGQQGRQPAQGQQAGYQQGRQQGTQQPPADQRGQQPPADRTGQQPPTGQGSQQPGGRRPDSQGRQSSQGPTGGGQADPERAPGEDRPAGERAQRSDGDSEPRADEGDSQQ